MAKATKKQAVTTGTFKLDNISGASEKFNPKEDKKPFLCVIRIDKEMYNKFKFLQYKFITQAKESSFDAGNTTLFFQHILFKMKERLVNDKKYKEATKSFVDFLHRKGRRHKGERSLGDKESISCTFGPYDDDGVTKEVHMNIMHSLSKIDKDKHFYEYSLLYFFFDIFNFLEKNIDNLIVDKS